MRIAIDAHAIGSRLTGNERYVHNLAAHLLAQDRDNEYVLFFTQENARREWKNRAPNLQTLLVSSNPFRRLGVDFSRQLSRLRPDVFHYQYTGPLFQGPPEVVTIHDVSFERHPEFFTASERLRLRWTVRKAIRSARKILTVSDFSKQEIVRELKAPEEKVRVIYNGVGPEFARIEDQNKICERLKAHRLGRPYFLCVGNLCRRKNQLNLVRGFARWCSLTKSPDHILVLVGKGEKTAQELREEGARLGLKPDRLRLLGYAPESDLPYLYCGADLVLNTSRYEGFGLPLIEAMACGIPVIASGTSCFPEIAADAARYVDPENADSIADAIMDVMDNSGKRQTMIQAGLRRVQAFRWDAAARETLKVYYEAVNGTGR